jgi:hypothetical protein
MSAAGIPFDEWGGVDQLEARRMARDFETGSMSLRIMFAAIGWSNLIGHAEFASGGLPTVLQTSDPQKGGLSIPTERGVNKALAEAAARGLISTESNVRCLVAPHWWVKAGGTGGRTCAEHRIRSPRRRRGAGS